MFGREDKSSRGSTDVLRRIAALCLRGSLRHARGTMGVLIWKIERCSEGGVWAQEWQLLSHLWNEKKTNYIFHVSTTSTFTTNTRLFD